MADRKKKTGEFLREQEAKELARLEELGVGGEGGPEAESGFCLRARLGFSIPSSKASVPSWHT